MRVHVTLTNRRASITHATKKQLAALDKHLSYYAPGYRFAPAYRARAWDGKKHLLLNNSMPAGLFRAERKAMNAEGLAFSVTVNRKKLKPLLPGIEDDARLKDPKYAYQGACVKAMINALPRGGGIVLSATGTGKTAMIGRFAARLPYTVLFVVDELGLLYQSQKELSDWLGEAVGVVGNSEFKPARVTVATIQTLHLHSQLKGRRTKKQVEEFQLWLRSQRVVIVDELHTQLARRNFQILKIAKPIAIYGATATLKLSRKEIRLRAHAFAGPVIFEFPMQQGIEAEVLTKATVLQLLFKRRPRKCQDFQEEYVYQVIRHPVKRAAVSEIVEFLHDVGKYLLILVERVNHIAQVSADLKLLGIPHALAHGSISRENRLHNIARFESGKIRVLVANKVFNKGINLKRVDAEIDLAEFKDTNSARQKLGRGVRLHKDKTHLLYIDIGTKSEPGDSSRDKNIAHANQVNGARYAKAAKRRASAFKKDGSKVIKKQVSTGSDSVVEIKKVLRSIEKDATARRKANIGVPSSRSKQTGKGTS